MHGEGQANEQLKLMKIQKADTNVQLHAHIDRHSEKLIQIDINTRQRHGPEPRSSLDHASSYIRILKRPEVNSFPISLTFTPCLIAHNHCSSYNSISPVDFQSNPFKYLVNIIMWSTLQMVWRLSGLVICMRMGQSKREQCIEDPRHDVYCGAFCSFVYASRLRLQFLLQRSDE